MRAELTAIWTGIELLPQIFRSFGVAPKTVYLHVYTDSRAALDALYRPDTQTNKKIRLLIKRIWKQVNEGIAQPNGGGCSFHTISRRKNDEDTPRQKELKQYMQRAHEMSRKARSAFKDI